MSLLNSCGGPITWTPSVTPTEDGCAGIGARRTPGRDDGHRDRLRLAGRQMMHVSTSPPITTGGYSHDTMILMRGRFRSCEAFTWAALRVSRAPNAPSARFLRQLPCGVAPARGQRAGDLPGGVCVQVSTIWA